MLNTLDVLIKIIIYILTLFSGFAIALRIHYTIISFWGFSRKKQEYDKYEDYLKFVILVPAHNEKYVIGSTINNHLNIDYDESLYEVHYIADNCSDETAEWGRKVLLENGKSNYHLHERFTDDPNKKGKPHALSWLMDKLNNTTGFYGKFDMFVILDADNHIDPHILSELNSQYLSAEEKPIAIQTYLDSKNGDNYISRGYKYAYRFVNRFYQLAKHRLGLNAAIGGTGFAVDMNYIEAMGGMNLKSLTEDLELQTIITLNGGRIYWNHNVRIYDEKPTQPYQSYVQKTRWAQGHWWVAFNYGWPLIKSMIKERNLKHTARCFDNLLYLFSMTTTVQLMLIFAYTIVITVLYGSNFDFYEVSLIQLIIQSSMFIFVIIYFLIEISYAMIVDGKFGDEEKVTLPKLVYNAVCVWFGGFIYMFSQIKGLLFWRRQNVWKKTTHNIQKVQDLKMEEEEKE